MPARLLKLTPWLAAAALWLAAAPVSAQEAPTAPGLAPGQVLKTSTRLVPPFVQGEGSDLTGFSAELWMALADRLRFRPEWTVKPTVVDLLKSVKSGETEVGISAISITAERDHEFDFSQPIFDSRLQILVRDTNGGSQTSSASFLAVLAQPGFLQLVGFMVLMTLLFAHLAFFVERRHEGGMIASPSYWPGILFSLWWSAGTLGTQADEMPKSPWGRFIALVWMFMGIVFLSFFTAALTTQLTVQQLQGNIKGPEDLPGKRVATVRGSTSAKYLRSKRARLVEVAKIEEAYDALLSRRVEAVVYDSPVLLYFSKNDGKNKVAVVGPVFRKEDYGIVFQRNSPLRKPINTALLSLKEDGTYDASTTAGSGRRSRVCGCVGVWMCGGRGASVATPINGHEDRDAC